MKFIKASDRLPTSISEIYFVKDANGNKGTALLADPKLWCNGKKEVWLSKIKVEYWLDEYSPETVSASQPIADTVDDWINVKDDLPKFHDMFTDRVLAFDGHVMKVVSLFKNHDGRILGYNTQQWCYMRDITHWQHLPKPPQFKASTPIAEVKDNDERKLNNKK